MPSDNGNTPQGPTSEEKGLTMELLAKLLFRDFPEGAPVNPPPFQNVVEFMRAVQRGCACGHSLEAHGRNTGRCQGYPKCGCPKFQINIQFSQPTFKITPSVGDPDDVISKPEPPPVLDRAPRATDEEEV
jgi:hypothetical protein